MVEVMKILAGQSPSEFVKNLPGRTNPSRYCWKLNGSGSGFFSGPCPSLADPFFGA